MGASVELVEDQLQGLVENRRGRLLGPGEPGDDLRGGHAQMVAKLAGAAELARGYLQGPGFDRERHGKNLIRSPARAQVAGARFGCSGLTHRSPREISRAAAGKGLRLANAMPARYMS